MTWSAVTSSGVDALGLHVPEEVGEVAAVGLDRVVGEQGVADPRHQGPGGGRRVAAGGLQGVGQEGFDLVGGRGVAVEEVAALGQRGEARWRAGRAGSAGGRSSGLQQIDCVTNDASDVCHRSLSVIVLTG